MIKFSGSTTPSTTITTLGTKISNEPFYGSRTFRYYKDGTAHYVYSNKYLPNIKDAKPRWFLILFYMPFVFAAFFMLFSMFTLPQKPLKTYTPENVMVVDTVNSLLPTEKEVLIETLQRFGENTGITSQVVVVNYDDCSRAGSISEYARYRYHMQFSNEDSLLILLTTRIANNKINWGCDITYGDNARDVMIVFLEELNMSLQSQIVVDNNTNPVIPLATAFDKAVTVFDEQKVEFNFAMLFPAIFILGFVSVHAYIMIFAGTKKDYKNSELVEITADTLTPMDDSPPCNETSNNEEENELIKCRYCGFEYHCNKDNRCPNCRALN